LSRILEIGSNNWPSTGQGEREDSAGTLFGSRVGTDPYIAGLNSPDHRGPVEEAIQEENILFKAEMCNRVC
jgi:hypothetical protein